MIFLPGLWSSFPFIEASKSTKSLGLHQAEFAVGFERMQGKKTLWPFAFHCTGMPIQVCLFRSFRFYMLPTWPNDMPFLP